MKFIKAKDEGNGGCSLLHTSALSGSLDITRYLVSEGAVIDVIDTEGRKPVHIATEKGFQDILEFYLNCNNNLEDEKASLLLMAASYGQANICDFLIKRNADVNACYVEETLINLALKKNHKEVLYVLLNYGVYYNKHPPTFIKDNETGSLLRKIKRLFIAVRKNKPVEVENLLSEESASKYCLANAKCVKKQTVLHYASWKGYEKVVNVLLKYNTNPNALTETGNTPLHYAVKFSHFRIVKALLSNGAVYNAVSQTCKTPLDHAADQDIGNFLLFLHEIFTKVLNTDASVRENLIRRDKVMRVAIRTKNREGKTLLDVAYISDFPKIEQLYGLFETDLVPELRAADKYLLEKKYHEAALVSKSILGKRTAIFGSDSQPVLDEKLYLACIFKNQGDLDKAMELYQEVYEGRKNSLGEENQMTLLAKSCKASILLQKGNAEESERIYEAIYVKLRNKLISDDINMINFEYGYSSALLSVKKFDKVLKINYEIQKKIEMKKNYEHRILLAESLYITALALAEQEKLVEAKEFLEKVYEIRRNVLSPHDPDTLKALSEIAKVLSRLGMYDESLKRFEEILAVQKSHQPVDHIDILNSEYRVGEVLCRQEMFVTALKIFLSLELKLARIAPDSDLMKKNKSTIEVIKYEISKLGSEGLFDEIRKKVIESEVNQ